MEKSITKQKTRVGLSVFAEGAGIFLRFPSLMIYGLISMLLTIICFVAMVFVAIYSTEYCIDTVSSWLELDTWSTILRWLTYAGFTVGFFFFIFFTFVTFSSIISIPFMDMLSAGIERRLSPHDEDASFWFGIKKGIASSTVMMFKMLLIMIVSLPLLLIPMVGTVVYFLINAWYAGFGYLDFPMGRRGWTYKEKCEFMKHAKKSQLMFGSVIYGMTMIPILNLVIIPWATAAGTLLFLKIKAKNSLNNDPINQLTNE